MGTSSMTQAGISTADTSLLSNVLREAIFTASEKSIAGDVFSVYDMTGTPGLTVQIPIYPEATAETPTQSQDVTGEAITTTNATITASEIAARIDVSDLLAESTARNMASDVGVMLGNALAEKIDSQAFSLFTEANIENDVGDNATELTPENILNAVYQLRNVNAPTDAQGDYFAVLHPGQAFRIAKSLATSGYASGGATALSDTGNSLMLNYSNQLQSRLIRWRLTHMVVCFRLRHLVTS
jgi:N4-gp56 family major capsid protein